MVYKETPVNISIVNENMSIISGTLGSFCNESIFDSMGDLVLNIGIGTLHNMMFIIEIIGL